MIAITNNTDNNHSVNMSVSNVEANLCVRPVVCSPCIANLHRVRYI
jgi:hypothetical protein